MAKAAKPPAPKTGSSDDLIPRSMLPDSSVIPEWRQFGYGAEGPAVPKPAPKKPGGKAAGGYIQKMAKGGMPDLTGDGKITRADVLKGRGVFKKGGAVKSSASKRADGIAVRGKTRGKMV